VELPLPAIYKCAMHATARLAPFVAIALAGLASAADNATSAFVVGTSNPQLADGAAALEAGRYERGIRLTLAGLERPNNPGDEAAGYANLCAGYAALKRWKKALPHCDRSLAIDAGNWRALNNRAAVHAGLRDYDRAMADVTAALRLAPDSAILQKSLRIIIQHREADATLDRRRKPVKA
jgi:tetratricopeptide (TPR) repeat protein